MVDKIRELLMSSDEVNYKLAIELCKGQNIDIEELKKELCPSDLFWSYYSYDSKPYYLNIASVGFYAHGKLEEDLKFDILYLQHNDWNQVKQQYNIFIEEGIRLITIIGINNKRIEAQLFCWKDNFDRYHGLAVYPNDIKAKTYALNKYNEKSICI